MEIGVLCFSHVMLVLAELIVYSMRGLACILAKWFWPTEMNLSLSDIHSELQGHHHVLSGPRQTLGDEVLA